MRWSLGTCEPLDRLLARSGCIAKHRIDDFSPLTIRTMAPAEGRSMRLFGFALRSDVRHAVQVAFDVEAGVETARASLPFGQLEFFVQPSLSGTTVAAAQPAASPGVVPMGIIVDAADGTILQEVSGGPSVRELMFDERGGAFLVLEGDPLRDVRLVAEPDPKTGGVKLLSLDRSEEVTTLAPPDPYEPASVYPADLAVRASPSGRYVALINASYLPEVGGTRIDVWDVEEQRHLGTLWSDAAHDVETNAAWTADEMNLVALHRPDEGNHIEVYVFARP